MRLITPDMVLEWASRHPDAKSALGKWMDLIQDGQWKNLVELRETFAAADEVLVKSGRPVTVFNIGGNKHRLIAAIHYNRKIVYAMLFLTHAEYSKDRWKRTL